MEWNDTTQAFHNTNNNLARVDHQLNEVAAVHGMTKQWTRRLVLADSLVSVSFDQPASVVVDNMAAGVLFDEVLDIAHALARNVEWNKLHVVDKQSGNEVAGSHTVAQNMDVVLCFVVSVCGDVGGDGEKCFVENG